MESKNNIQKEQNQPAHSAKQQKSHLLLYISLGAVVTALILSGAYFALWSWQGRKCKSNADCASSKETDTSTVPSNYKQANTDDWGGKEGSNKAEVKTDFDNDGIQETITLYNEDAESRTKLVILMDLDRKRIYRYHSGNNGR